MRTGSISNFVDYVIKILKQNWNTSVTTLPLFTDYDISKDKVTQNSIYLMTDSEEPKVTGCTNRFQIMSYQFELIFNSNSLENITLMHNEAKSILLNFHDPDIGDMFKPVDRVAYNATSGSSGHLTMLYTYPVFMAKRSVSIPT